jgi:hypothetical protein
MADIVNEFYDSSGLVEKIDIFSSMLFFFVSEILSLI